MSLIPILAPDAGIDGVEIRVTTRQGGVSQPPYESMNLADHVGDLADCVFENRRRIAIDIQGHAICWIRQSHGIRAVEAREGLTPCADAQWTLERNRPLAILTADCLSVVLMVADASCVGIAHAGWRGLAAGVLESLLSAMPVESSLVTAWLGPSISAAAYEVGAEVKDVFEQKLGTASGACFRPSICHGRWMLNLSALARHRLSEAGVSDISGGDRCTYGEAEHFFSHRRDGPATGRMATLAWLS